MLTNLFLGQTAEEKLYIEDVFSTWLYTGNGSTQTITNGIDLAGKGGLVWVKNRGSAANHFLMDTNRGIYGYLSSNTTAADPGTGEIQSYNSNGFSLVTSSNTNASSNTYASWTFRKAPKFFTICTWTGNGVAGRQISHDLGVAPGMIIVKGVTNATDWSVYHRGLSNTQALALNLTDAATAHSRWNNTSPTDTVFTISNSSYVNASGATYVAYLFAHDTTADGVIQCGSLSASSATTVTLGWEPQYVLLKQSSGAQSWYVVDVMRGLSYNNFVFLQPNASDAEADAGVVIEPTATGFTFKGANLGATSGETYIYMAIRRGPMRTPTDGTKVFSPFSYTGSGINDRSFTTNFATDATIWANRDKTFYTQNYFTNKLVGIKRNLDITSTAAEADTGEGRFGGFTNTQVVLGTTSAGGFNYSGMPSVFYAFSRAPGFFDVVCYTGTGSARTVSHNLGVAPELMIIKPRTGSLGWTVYSASISNTEYLMFNTTAAKATGTTRWNSTTPTSTVFTVGSNIGINNSGVPFVAYLFSTCPGVSKVGSYTGNGSSQNIDCGFTNGARFVLIKRTDSTGDWLVSDTARGIVSGNDPSLALNSTAAEVTTLDWLDPLSTGFTVNQESTNNANVNGATYLYLSIA